MAALRRSETSGLIILETPASKKCQAQNLKDAEWQKSQNRRSLQSKCQRLQTAVSELLPQKPWMLGPTEPLGSQGLRGEAQEGEKLKMRVSVG